MTNLKEIGKKEYVLHRVNIEGCIYSRRWFSTTENDAIGSYFHLCFQCDNPGALFIQGMEDYFLHKKSQQGMWRFEKSASLGHTTVAYAIGLIFISGVFNSDGEKHRGFELLKNVKARTGKRFVDCRVRVKSFMERSWWKHEFSLKHKSILFTKTMSTAEESVHEKKIFLVKKMKTMLSFALDAHMHMNRLFLILFLCDVLLVSSSSICHDKLMS
ncbi:hypothetical protein V2J09_000788 [Rumex salicifolius]